MTPEETAMLKRFQAGEQLSEEEMSALYPSMVDEKIKRAKGAKTREFLFNALSQGIRAGTGLPLQQSLRNRRLATDKQQRALAREDVDQDTTEARTKYFELRQNFVQGIVDDAQASVTPENEAEIKRAELESQREAKLLEMVQGGDKKEISEEDAKARAAAQRFINAVSRGQGSTAAIQGQMSKLNTQYALDRFSYWVNSIAREATVGEIEEQRRLAADLNNRVKKGEITSQQAEDEYVLLTKDGQDEILKTMGRPDGSGFYDPVDYGGSATLPESYKLDSTYMKHRQAIIDGNKLRPNPSGFSSQQLLVLDTGDVRQAMERSKIALENLSSLPGIEQQIQKVARQNLSREQLAGLGDDFTAGDVFDQISGLSQREAFATDARTQNEVSQAMDILMRTGDYSPLTGDKRMLNDMESKGLNPKEYAFFLKNKYQDKTPALQPVSEEAVTAAVTQDKADDEAVETPGSSTTPSKPPTASAAAANPGKPGDPVTAKKEAVTKRLPGGAGKRGGGDIFVT